MTAATATATPSTHMTDADAIRKFVLGGKATFTIRNAKTGVRYTYRVQCKRDLVKKGRGVISPYFVSLMRGSDNTSNYKYIGYIVSKPTSAGWNEYRHGGGKSYLRAQDEPNVAFAWLWALINGRNTNGTPRANTLADYPDLEFWHEGRCCCCSRLLTVPASIASGIGPVCAGWY